MISKMNLTLVTYLIHCFLVLYFIYENEVYNVFVAITRDENGLCIKCEPGEPGEFVGKIVKGKRNIFFFKNSLNIQEE